MRGRGSLPSLRFRTTLLLALTLAASSAAASAHAAALRIGVARADITPLTGLYKGGWACACARALGQHTRLYARVVVLQEGRTKVALVAEDLSFLSAGMIRDAATLLRARGYTERNIVDSATHTHGSQSGFMNFSGYNSIFPKADDPTDFKLTSTDADPALYSFMVRALASAIRRADDDLGPGVAAWGHADLLGVTQNRSLEAHLANYGIDEPVGSGRVSQDPHGYRGTIDPSVDVLRVDRLSGGRRVPAGMFSVFANHGTVVKPTFPYYTADHQGAAERVVEAAVRRAGRVPAGTEVVNAFGNGDAGDMTAGIAHSGPADAETVGRREAAAMLTAWRRAGRSLSRTPALRLRWTRLCLCGQETSDGPLDTTPVVGQAAGAGSEELRTIFYDEGLAHEGDRLPADVGPQGRKVQVIRESGGVPQAVPLAAVRIGDRLLVTVPAEPTVGAGALIRDAVFRSVPGAGIRRVVLAAYADEYLSYVTTPREYDAQHYEGGFTLYGRTEALALRDGLVDLARRLVAGRAAPAPYAYDPNHGVHVSGARFPAGAARGRATAQPARRVARLAHASFRWTGAPDGRDRPVDRAFVNVQRFAGTRRIFIDDIGLRQIPVWRRAADDLGLQIVWDADQNGHYRARWEIPIDAPAGRYRIVVTARRYRLTSRPFVVRPSRALTAAEAAGALELTYPPAVTDQDWTARPARATRITVRFRTERGTLTRRGRGRVRLPAQRPLTVPAGAARDAFGNANGRALRIG